MQYADSANYHQGCSGQPKKCEHERVAVAEKCEHEREAEFSHSNPSCDITLFPVRGSVSRHGTSVSVHRSAAHSNNKIETQSTKKGAVAAEDEYVVIENCKENTAGGTDADLVLA